MIYRKLDSNGDMEFGKGAHNFYKDVPEAVAQAVLTRLKLFQGEWFLDTSAGVPYNTKILGFGNIPFYDAIIQEIISTTPGVDQITAYTSYISATRDLSIQATINTIYGTTILSTSI